MEETARIASFREMRELLINLLEILWSSVGIIVVFS